MQDQALPFSRDLVLIGGGHTHALVLRKWAMRPLPGARLTVIDPGSNAPYSGMLPGFIAGHYKRDMLDIDLVRLCRHANARLILARANGLDLSARVIHLDRRPPVAFDVASFDIGITSNMPGIPGFHDHAVPAKPLAPFAQQWRSYLDQTGPATLAVIGGGVAGVEIAMAQAHALKTAQRPYRLTLVDRGRILKALRPPTARTLRSALERLEIEVIENTGVNAITKEELELENGTRIAAAFITGAAGAKAQPWLTDTGLDLVNGFICVDNRLRSSDPMIFAVGDCAHMSTTPRPKAGVFAVRQAPVLYENLLATLIGQGGLRTFRPQRDYLKLISLGEKSALADRFGMCLSGPAMWRWKDRIDQKFMRQFRDMPKTEARPLPWPRAKNSDAAKTNKPLCGGCGAKIGRTALLNALGSETAGDDAAILTMGDVRQVISTDHLRGMVEDPYVMARIAATHALGDIWAMGATPQAALINIVLPEQTSELARRALSEIMQGAKAAFQPQGIEIAGGHSTLGAELTIGFTLTGLVDAAPVGLHGARVGDSLILTKPIGTGVIMAADMLGEAKGAWVVSALDHMTASQHAAAQVLRRAHAMTDVTGFGLAGHVLNICQASGTGAEVVFRDVPMLDGAVALARRGHHSSLFAENKSLLPQLPRQPETDLLFDPQTAGGLLAAVPNGPETLKDLAATGTQAAIIGRITDQTGVVSIL